MNLSNMTNMLRGKSFSCFLMLFGLSMANFAKQASKHVCPVLNLGHHGHPGSGTVSCRLEPKPCLATSKHKHPATNKGGTVACVKAMTLQLNRALMNIIQSFRVSFRGASAESFQLLDILEVLRLLFMQTPLSRVCTRRVNPDTSSTKRLFWIIS
jgi:hypothetical protein